MTTQSNTFRLQRLTKTIGTRQHSLTQYQPKQTFKLAALNSINRGVKYNDITHVSGRDLNKLRKEPEVSQDILYDNAHLNLADIRKNYDSAHKEKGFRELSISKLKQEKNKLSITQRELVENKGKGGNQVKSLNDNLENIKLMFSQAEMQKKVLLSMRDRLKTDKVVYDHRKFNLQKQLRFLKKQKQVIIVDRTDISQSDDRTSKVQKKLLNQLRAEQDQRQQHLTNLQSMIQQRQRVNQLNQFRSREIQEIAQRAMQDKDDNQKNWDKLYLANKLVSRLLRSKMDKQMNKFFIVQSAFKTIKIATGVNDAQNLVQKFLNKEIAYGDLLGKIAENQKKILILKEEGDELRQQFKELQSQKQVIDSTKRPVQNIQKQLKKLSQVDQKQETSIIYKQKLRSWIAKNNKKMNSILGKSYPVTIERSIKNISTAFIDYLKNLSSQLDNFQEKDVIEDIKPTLQNQNILKKNSRIKNEREEDEEQQGNNVQQGDVISAQRLDLLRSNDKFMKQIRRKFDQKRKIAAQAASPKKKQPTQKVPVKKPEDD